MFMSFNLKITLTSSIRGKIILSNRGNFMHKGVLEMLFMVEKMIGTT